MNSAFNRTLSLLVEIKSNIPGKGGEPKRKKVDLGPLGKATPSFTMSTNPKPSSDEGPTVSRNNPETLEFLKPRAGEKGKPRKSFTDRLLDVLKRGASKVKGFFKRKNENFSRVRESLSNNASTAAVLDRMRKKDTLAQRATVKQRVFKRRNNRIVTGKHFHSYA